MSDNCPTTLTVNIPAPIELFCDSPSVGSLPDYGKQGDLVAANNLSDVDNTVVALNNLGGAALGHTHTSGEITDLSTTIENHTAVVLNTAKVGITSQQAADIVTNNSKVGITPQQTADILANNAKVGITPQQTADILSNNAKISYTDAVKVGLITVTQAVDLDQMEIDIAALANGMVYSGDWDASSGNFPGGGIAQTGAFYNVSVAGTMDGIEFAVGDSIIAKTDNASTTTYAANWTKKDQTDAVQTVAGRIGNVVITTNDLADFDSEVASNSAVAANTAKNSYPTNDATKVGLISVVNPVDLDEINSRDADVSFLQTVGKIFADITDRDTYNAAWEGLIAKTIDDDSNYIYTMSSWTTYTGKTPFYWVGTVSAALVEGHIPDGTIYDEESI